MWADFSDYSRPVAWVMILLAALLILGGMMI